jgi:hypothetical protein
MNQLAMKLFRVQSIKMVRKVKLWDYKRGFEPYEYNTTEGYELAKANSKSPLDSLDRNSGEGQAMRFIVSVVMVLLVTVKESERKISWCSKL